MELKQMMAIIEPFPIQWPLQYNRFLRWCCPIEFKLEDPLIVFVHIDRWLHLKILIYQTLVNQISGKIRHRNGPLM